MPSDQRTLDLLSAERWRLADELELLAERNERIAKLDRADADGQERFAVNWKVDAEAR